VEIIMIGRSTIAALMALLVLAGPEFATAQIQLTPAQQQMLNSLPPAQRQQAMDQLRILNQQNANGSSFSSLKEEVSSPPASGAPSAAATPGEIEELRAEPDSRLVLNFVPRPDLSREDRAAFDQDRALQQIRGRQYFELDDTGVLNLAGVAAIPLLGLSAEEIEQRLEAEDVLDVYDIDVSILESTTTGVDALEAFGYDLFEQPGAGFEPVTTGPVPPDYVLGPGDSIRVQLYGNDNGIYEFEVTRDGILNLPELGPITVAGLPFSEFREDLNRRVREMLIGTQVSVTMGQLRTIRIFVLGDVNQPGSYVVSSLATMSTALYQSGGISRIGSLRNIQLKRNGRTVARLDLYDALLAGDTSGDLRLQPGDVVFVPPVGSQISVSGAVKRPAIYETRGKTSIQDAIDLAGGFLADAYPDGARVERIEESQARRVVSLDADSSEAATFMVSAGDIVTIPRVLPDLEETVTLVGHVQRPGPYEWRQGMRLADLISSELELKPGADLDYVLVRREDPSTRRVSAKSANLSDALAARGSAENIALQARDTVHVFSLAFGRQRVIQPLLQDLELQGRFGEPHREASISGEVKAPGSYPLEQGMRVSDLIRAGGNLSEQAYALRAEIARYEIINDAYRETEVIDVDLAAVLRGDESADLFLEEHDNLRISRVPDWDTLWSVTLEGEVKFPGRYRIRQGETLQQVLERAGGLTDEAFPEGAIFLRDDLRAREQQQIEALARRLEADLTSLALQNQQSGDPVTVDTGRQLLSQLRETEAVGRLVVDLDRVLANGSNVDPLADLEMRDGDQLLVPKKAQEVTVLGEIQQSTSHLFQPGLRRDDYIDMSGGLTRRADKKMIYVVRASGAVVTEKRSKWIGRNGGIDIRPGDTIVVPQNIDRIRPLTLWANVTQILYQAAIAVAAVQTFRD
jgi:protein involved in polysaccharide export with SLBB domain